LFQITSEYKDVRLYTTSPLPIAPKLVKVQPVQLPVEEQFSSLF
jgi:hypothetical protein